MSKKTKGANNILLPGLEEFETGMMGNFENDPTLEAELMAILGGGGKSNAPRKPKIASKNANAMNIDKNLLNLDLKEDDDDGEIDENDPELLAELNDMLDDDEDVAGMNTDQYVPEKPKSSVDNVKTLESLKQQYEAAIHETKATNDTGKTRRYERSLKLIDDLLRKTLRGEQVNEADFPPSVFVKGNAQKNPYPEVKPVENANISPPSPPKRTPQKIEDKLTNSAVPGHMKGLEDDVLQALQRRQMEYKSAAVAAKAKDIELAKGLMIVVKQFDEVIKVVKAGEKFDLEDMPPPPSEFKLSDLNQGEVEVEVVTPVVPQRQEVSHTGSLADELRIRRDFYKESMEKAKAENNAGKMRRLMRVIQQYDEAIIAHGKKGVYAYEELPPPPGKSVLSRVAALQGTGASPGGVAVVPGAQLGSMGAVRSPQGGAAGVPQTKPQNKTAQFLEGRQAQFKAAALKAKTEGDLILAKELLRQAKGIEHMIEATAAGLPVDLSQVPSLPTEAQFESVNVEQCEVPDDMKTGDKQTLLRKMQGILQEQIKTCKGYEQSVMKAGDVLGAKRFQSLASSCEKDLDGLRCLAQRQADLPSFHYEYKIMSVISANNDLGECDLAVDVVKATDLAVPQGYTVEQLDTYVVLTLPFPTDNHQTYTTDTVRKTNCPGYNATTKFQVTPKSRVFQRLLRTKELTADIFYKKGFLQKDKLLGTSHIKMDKFESCCTIHECVDIYENRKLIGGKLEVKLRLRSAIGGPQSETVKEKWLVIDDFNKNSGQAAAFDMVTSLGPMEDLGSIEVLKYEINEFRRRLTEAGATVSTSLSASVKQKIREKEDAMRKQEAMLNSKDLAQRMSYIQYLNKLPQSYTMEAKKQLTVGNRDKAQSLMTKKKLVENEIERLKTKK